MSKRIGTAVHLGHPVDIYSTGHTKRDHTPMAKLCYGWIPLSHLSGVVLGSQPESPPGVRA